LCPENKERGTAESESDQRAKPEPEKVSKGREFDFW
jgi:hypothetical protein